MQASAGNQNSHASGLIFFHRQLFAWPFMLFLQRWCHSEITQRVPLVSLLNVDNFKLAIVPVCCNAIHLVQQAGHGGSGSEGRRR